MGKGIKSADIPATLGLVDQTRAELKSDITSVKIDMKAGFRRLEEKMDRGFSKLDKIFAKQDGLEEKYEAKIKMITKMLNTPSV